MARKLSPTTQKVLLLLAGGLALGLSGSPGRYFKILGAIAHDWKQIDKDGLRQSIKNLYRAKLVNAKRNKNGSYTLTISRKGDETALTYKIDNIAIPGMKKWDGKWRIVMSDIPEKYRRARNAMRRVLKRLGFFEYQKSVFVHPFECQDEIDFVIEFFRLRPWVRIAIADNLDNELHLKNHFDLL